MEKTIENTKYIYHYKYHRKTGNNINLRCRDNKCKETAQITINGALIEKNKCTLEYSQHLYAKKILAKLKIENNGQTIDDMKDIIYQEQYFKDYLSKFPLITYNEILKLFIEKYKNIDIKFTNKKFSSLKEKLKK